MSPTTKKLAQNLKLAADRFRNANGFTEQKVDSFRARGAKSPISTASSRLSASSSLTSRSRLPDVPKLPSPPLIVKQYMQNMKQANQAVRSPIGTPSSGRPMMRY
jgi:hypothetical protein